MKNLKKVLALVVALTMVLGTVSFAAFTDVAEDSNVYTAVQTLSSLSILNGYEDGSFGPEKDITRAEFCAVVCRALGLGDPAKGATSFTDVAADHWASGYINLAAGQGIVNGYGNGLFGPEDNVTYEQAVKMLVVALGFEPMAAQKGGYPTGYLVVANTYGLTENVVAAGDAAPANRGVVAQLTYNALDIPMMAQTGFGTNVEFKIQDGNNGTNYVTLLNNLKVVKLEGTVEATHIIGNAAEGSIYFKVVDNFIKDATDTEYKDNSYHTIKLMEGLNADEYVGYSVEIFVKDVRGGDEIIAIMPGADSETITISKKDIAKVSTVYQLTNTEVQYYESATATKAKKLPLADVKKAIINNVEKTVYSSGLQAAFTSLTDDAEITFINNNSSSEYDKIIIKDYSYDIIDTVDADKDRFTTKLASGRFTFDFEDEAKSTKLLNKDGEAVALADFAEGDVIAYILDSGSKSATTYDWIEIINLGQNVVTGAVTEFDSNSNSVYVDGVEYELTTTIPKTPAVGEEGTYFLTPSGKIFMYEVDKAVASNYGYILEMDITTGNFANSWQIRLLTKDGSIQVYDVKDNWEIGVAANSDATIKVTKDSAIPSSAFIADVASDGANGSGRQFVTNADDRLVNYKLSNGKISLIKPVNATQIVSLAEYNADSMVIDSHLLEEDATIFNLVGKNMDDAFVTTISSLVDEGEYAGWVVTNSDNEKDCFVITSGKGAIDYTQDLAVIESVSKVSINDSDAWKLRYYVSGEEEAKELTVTEDTDIEYGLTINTLALHKGDVFMFAEDGNGLATSFAKIADVTADKWTLVNSAADAINAEDDLEIIVSYIKTEVKTTNGTNITVGTSNGSNIAANSVIVVKGDANGYTYDYKNADRITVYAGDWHNADTIEAAYDNKGVVAEDGLATYFIAIVENGVVSDIVTHSARASK